MSEGQSEQSRGVLPVTQARDETVEPLDDPVMAQLFSEIDQILEHRQISSSVPALPEYVAQAEMLACQLPETSPPKGWRAHFDKFLFAGACVYLAAAMGWLMGRGEFPGISPRSAAIRADRSLESQGSTTSRQEVIDQLQRSLATIDEGKEVTVASQDGVPDNSSSPLVETLLANQATIQPESLARLPETSPNPLPSVNSPGTTTPLLPLPRSESGPPSPLPQPAAPTPPVKAQSQPTTPPQTTPPQTTGIPALNVPPIPPPPPGDTLPTSEAIASAPTAVEPARQSTSVLVGLLDFGDRSTALFEMDGITHRVSLGENIGNSGWTLTAISSETVTLYRNGRSQSLQVGQSF